MWLAFSYFFWKNGWIIFAWEWDKFLSVSSLLLGSLDCHLVIPSKSQATSSGSIRGREAKWPPVFLKRWLQSPWEKSSLNSQERKNNSDSLRAKTCQEESTRFLLSLLWSLCYLESLIPFLVRSLLFLASSEIGKWLPGIKAKVSLFMSLKLVEDPDLWEAFIPSLWPFSSFSALSSAITYKGMIFIPYFTSLPSPESYTCLLWPGSSTHTASPVSPKLNLHFPLLIHNETHF